MVAEKGEGEVMNTTASRLRGAAELPHLGAGLNEGAQTLHALFSGLETRLELCSLLV